MKQFIQDTKLSKRHKVFAQFGFDLQSLASFCVQPPKALANKFALKGRIVPDKH
jgi:hypothetical protein